VQPGATGTVPSSISAATKPELVAPAAEARGNPRVLLAQAGRGRGVPNPGASPAPAPPAVSPEKERQLEDAFLRGDPITEMPLAMEINYFQLNKAEYFVPLTVKIPGSELSLARNVGAQQTSFDFISETKDPFGAVVQNMRDKVSINLSGAGASQLASIPVEYDTGFTLLPGQYSLKLLARNNETGRIGTYQTVFTVPNLNKEDQGIPISSVVLSSQRVETTDAINAGKTANPLVADGRRLIPSVTRVFSKSREMYVYLQAYQREAGDTQPLFAFATFYQGQSKILETAPTGVTQGADARSRAVPLSLSISLASLNPGEYTCQITVRSPGTQKTAVWQAPIVIEP
jgi:hypothetical protein